MGCSSNIRACGSAIIYVPYGTADCAGKATRPNCSVNVSKLNRLGGNVGDDYVSTQVEVNREVFAEQQAEELLRGVPHDSADGKPWVAAGDRL